MPAVLTHTLQLHRCRSAVRSDMLGLVIRCTRLPVASYKSLCPMSQAVLSAPPRLRNICSFPTASRRCPGQPSKQSYTFTWRLVTLYSVGTSPAPVLWINNYVVLSFWSNTSSKENS